MGIRLSLIVSAVVILGLAGCSQSEKSPAAKEQFTIRIQNNAEGRRYREGFTCFLAFADESGKVFVPMRYAMQPRRGFMDGVYLTRRVQDPVFWAGDGSELSYEKVTPPKVVFVGHRAAEKKDWDIVKFEVAVLKVDLPKRVYLVDCGSMTGALVVTNQDASDVLNALSQAEKSYRRISDEEYHR